MQQGKPEVGVKTLHAKEFWNAKIHEEIPATQLLGISIDELDHQSIRISAPLSHNINGHHTGFAGSIFTTGITAGWTLLSHHLQHHQIQALVVAGNADIKYKRPLTKNFIANCSLPEEHSIDNWKSRWQHNKSAKQVLTITIGDGIIAAAQINATFYIKHL